MAKYLGIPLQVASGTTVTPTYGSPEYVENGDFLGGASNWTVTAGGWAAAPVSGVWFCDGTQTGNTNLAQAGVFNELLGRKVLISFKVESYSAGSVKFLAGDASIVGTPKSSTGFSDTVGVVTDELTGLNIQADANFIGSVSIVSVKEVPFVLGDNQVVNGTFSSLYSWEGSNVGWSTSEGQAIHSGFAGGDIKQELNLVVGKTYQATATMDFTGETSITNSSFQIRKSDDSGSWVQLNAPELTPDAKKTYTLTFEAQETNPFIRFYSQDNVKVSNVSLQEVGYNYLQVVGGDLLKESKVGDVVFNYTDDNEAVVVQVIDNDTLLLSNDVLSDAGDSFSIFAPNGDTRGNQILRIDNYIISEYDEASSLPDKSSFWFAAGIEADKVTLTQLNEAVNTYFVADVIERFVQRLNAQSATASRLDIPLNEFRDHKYNQVLTTTAIILS
jgi:hypothetical protein